MRKRFSIAAASMTAGLILSSLAIAKDELPEITEEGLHKISDTELAVVYAKEGVDLSVYDKVLLVDATVAFQKNWQRDQNRSYAFKVNAKDMERIKTRLAELFREVFTEKLNDAGHEVVTEAADDVLVVRPAIVDLDVKAPDTRNASRSYQLTESAGEMTLYVELYDSVTGDILVKALDRKADRKSSFFQWQTRADNRVAAKRALGSWADLLTAALSEAQNSASSSDKSE